MEECWGIVNIKPHHMSQPAADKLAGAVYWLHVLYPVVAIGSKGLAS